MESSGRSCTACRNRLVQKTADGVRFRIDGPVSVDEHGVCHARCYWCKADVELPLELSKSFALEPERVVVLTRAPNTRTHTK